MKCFLLISFFISFNLFAFSQNIPILKIGLIADPQYEDANNQGDRYYRESLWKLQEAVDTFNFYQIDIVQNLGDIINHNWESFNDIMPIYNNLNANIENYHLLGNHDFLIDNSHKHELLNLFSMPDYYYSYVKNNWRFIVLDATDYSFYANYIHNYDMSIINSYYDFTDGNENHHGWNAAIGSEQQNWLLQQLNDAEQLNQKVIIYSHIPIRPLNTEDNLWNDYEIIDIIESKPNVVAYINGHHHYGNFIKAGNVNYLSMYGMLNNMTNSYGILEIYTDKIKLIGFGNQESYIFNIESSIEKNKSNSFKVAPNPCNDHINVSVSGKVNLNIFNSLGKNILEINEFESGIIDLSNYNKGIYFIKVFNKSGAFIKKIFIK